VTDGQRNAVFMFGWRREMQVLVYVSAVLIGVIAGMLTHSAVVAALAALAYALAWHTLGKLP
jgi:hypothetical protein